MSNFILDFSLTTKEEKKNFLRENADKNVISELSLFDPEEFYQEFKNLKGVMSFAFSDESKKGEIHMREKNQAVLDELKKLGYSPVEISFAPMGFITPRTKALIINEAYFALNEDVASREDIDRAMEFGVNYPKGPFAWVKGKEKLYFQLLQNLFLKFGDERYKPSSTLTAFST